MFTCTSALQGTAVGGGSPAAARQFVGTVWTLEVVLPHAVWSPEEEGLLEEGVRRGGTLAVDQQGTRRVVPQLELLRQDCPPCLPEGLSGL